MPLSKWIKLAGIFGFFAVAFGAFGAHGLRNYLSAPSIQIYQTGVFYHFVHTLALVSYGIIQEKTERPDWPGVCFATGILLFSGSLYILAITGVRWVGAITPIGGLLFLAGWTGFFVPSSRK